MALLVRTPSPYPNESLFSFVLRVSESNGYENPRQMLMDEGFTRGQLVAAGFSVKLFAPMLGQDPATLESMAYFAEEGGVRRYRILDHIFGVSLVKQPLRLSRPAYCPLCAEEDGFVGAFWDLSAAVACIRHRVWTLDSCPDCGAPVKWFRRKFLSCDCGSAFSKAQLPVAVTPTLEFMAIIEAKLYRRSLLDLPNASNFPLEILDALPFVALLELLMWIATYESGADVKKPEASLSYKNVAEVFADWPNGYHRFLRRLGDRFLSQGAKSAGLRRQFESFYRSLFVHGALAAHFGFMKAEFMSFGLQHWENASVDKRMLSETNPEDKRFVLKSAVAQRHGISQPTMRRLIAEGSFVTKTIKVGPVTKVVIDLEKSTLPLSAKNSLSARQGAAFLGLPVQVLKQLRSSGVYVKSARRGHGESWFQDDLNDFLARGRALVPDTPSQGDGVSLYAAMRLKLRDVGAKTSIVVAALEGRIKVVGATGENLGGLILDKAELEPFVQSLRQDTSRQTYLPKEVAKLTGMAPSAVSGAIGIGILSATKSAGRFHIAAAEVERFNAEFVVLSQVAATLTTTSRRLLGVCKNGGVSVVSAARRDGGPPQPLIRRCDRDLLEALWKLQLAA